MMIKNRKNRQLTIKLVYHLALMAFVAGNLAAFTPEVCRAEVVDRIVAIVNDEIILLSELNQDLKPYVARIRTQGYDEETEHRLLFQVREDILNRLIDERLTDQEVKRYRIKVGEAEIDAMIERIKETNYYSDEDLRRALSLEGLTLESYRKQLKEQILRGRLVTMQVKSKIVITEKDVRAYYEDHQANYQGTKRVHLRNIVMPHSASGDELENEETLRQMKKVFDALEAGSDFSDMAKQYSKSPLAAEGGDLGEFDLESLADKIKDAIKDLETGQHTPIIDTEQGYQIFYIEDVKLSDTKTLEEVTGEIEDKLYNEIVDRNFKKWLEDLRSRSHIKIVK
jgi:peptidyl-prolyl cis-trans isomerase SurA